MFRLFSRNSEIELNLEVGQPHRSFVLKNTRISHDEEGPLPARSAGEPSLSIIHGKISL